MHNRAMYMHESLDKKNLIAAIQDKYVYSDQLPKRTQM